MQTTVQELQVNRSDHRDTRLAAAESVGLGSGRVRVAVERFALTANNVSYAVHGDTLRYWDFFPLDDQWGRVPAMGVGSVVESAHDDIPLGSRYFGFYPMAEEHVIEATPTPHGMRDVGAHRSVHAATYVNYVDTATDPTFPAERTDEFLLLRGLFVTAQLVDDFITSHGDFGADQVVITSASSKTAIGTAFCLSSRGVRCVGVTSEGNRDFVESTGFYDIVVTYGEVEALEPSTPSVLVDFSGDGEIIGRLHAHFVDSLRHSSRVGGTHWAADGSPGFLPGPKPEFFFAPSRLKDRPSGADPEDAGPATARFHTFLEDSPRWLSIRRVCGGSAVRAAYEHMVQGMVPPDLGLICGFGGD